MGEYMVLDGTKDKIVEELAKELNLPQDVKESDDFRKFTYYFVDFLDENRDALMSEDDDFLVDTSQQSELSQGFVTADAKYFIGLKKSTYIAGFVIFENMLSSLGISPYISGIIYSGVNELVPHEDMALVRKLNTKEGESCVLLEALRNRKKGIGDKYFESFRGECINNNIDCKFRKDGRCECNREETKKILEALENAGVLKEKRGKYFYMDFI
jgi:hypothetical protein